MPNINPIILAGSGPLPSTNAGSIFTGATIPLTYKDNTIVYENEYEYESATHNITITGLTGRATITGNGTKSVKVVFDVTSATSSLKNFTITCVKDTETLVYNGMHAHYGTTVTGILTFAYTNVTKDGNEGTVGTNYLFIETNSTTLPLFSTNTTLWNGIYSYQVLNVLIGKFSSTSIGASFLRECILFNQPLIIPSGVTSISMFFLAICYSFNQPLTIPNGVLTIGNAFMNMCLSFNQKLTLSTALTSWGVTFMGNCYAFNQPLTIPSGVTDMGNNFLNAAYSFNQPLTIPSGVTSFGTSFLLNCWSFNHPLTIPSGVTSISNSFLEQCRVFNQPLTIPSGVTSIGNSFLNSCFAFNQPLTIPSGVTSIGTNLLYNCFSLSAINYESSTYPTDNNSISQTTNSKTSADGSGIMVYGTNRAGLITALPDRTATPFRKLINGGS